MLLNSRQVTLERTAAAARIYKLTYFRYHTGSYTHNHFYRGAPENKVAKGVRMCH